MSTTGIPGELVFQAEPGVVASLNDEGMVLYHQESGQVFSANRAGARIWHGINEHRDVNEIVGDISRFYSVADEEARAHTMRFLEELLQRGLIKRGREQ